MKKDSNVNNNNDAIKENCKKVVNQKQRSQTKQSLSQLVRGKIYLDDFSEDEDLDYLSLDDNLED